jgi:hypothetical protein
MSEVFRFGQLRHEKWSFPNTRGERTSSEIHAARYRNEPLYHAASCAEALDYLIYGCPTTALAVKKLRMIRAAAQRPEEEPNG